MFLIHPTAFHFITLLKHFRLNPQVETCTFILLTTHFSIQDLRCSIVIEMKLILFYLLFLVVLSQEKLVKYLSRHLIYIK